MVGDRRSVAGNGCEVVQSPLVRERAIVTKMDKFYRTAGSDGHAETVERYRKSVTDSLYVGLFSAPATKEGNLTFDWR
jgi:hypothetical protein